MVKKPVPCPCDRCPKVKDCKDTCPEWDKWIMNREGEGKYRQETLK